MRVDTHEICGRCKATFPIDPRDRRRYVEVCTFCLNTEIAFNKLSGGMDVDADYAYHEIAHYVMLFGREPRRCGDMRRMEKILDKLSNRFSGRAQVHEMRTLALQGEAYERLGWNPSWEHLVDLSWQGIKDAITDARAGSAIVHTRDQALAFVLARRPQTSKRKIVVLMNVLLKLRGETKHA